MGLSTGYLAPLASAAGACPSAMSRAAVIALRDSNSLSVDCHYVVNDHVQGRLVAGTTVLLHATSTNETSQVAQVNTTYDNEAWFGLYDIDQAQLIHLRDNRGNEVDGAAQIAAFDWGNTSYTNVKVLDGGVLTATIGSTAVKRTVTVSGASVLNITNFNGTLEESEISESAQVNLSNTSLLFTGNTITDGAQFLAQGLTVVGGVVQRCVARNSAVTLSGAGAPTITNTDFLSSTVAHNSGATVTWASCEFASGAVVTHTGTGAQSLTRVTVRSGSQIQHTGAGPLTGLNSDVLGRAYWWHLGAGTMSITDHITGPGALCRNETTNDGNVTILRGCTEFSGVVRCYLGTITLTDFEVRGTVETLGPLSGAATTTATVINLNGGACERATKVTNLGPGSITGTRVFVSGPHNSDVNVSVVRAGVAGGSVNLTDVVVNSGNIQVEGGGTLAGTRLHLATNARVDHRGVGAVTATDTELTTRSLVYLEPASTPDITFTTVKVGFSANVIVRAGSAGALFFEDAILHRGLVEKRATSTTGVFRFGQITAGAATTTLDSCNIIISGTASLYQIVSGSYGRFSAVGFGGNRDVKHQANDIKNTTVILHTGTGGVAGTVLDQMLDCTLERTTVNFASSGAAINSLEMLNAVSNSTFNINGTTASQRWVRFKMGASATCTFTDCTATMIHTNTTVLDASTVTFTNVAVAKWIEDGMIQEGSTLTVTSPTVAGRLNRLVAQAQGTITASGAAGVVSRAMASAGATVNFTGGANHFNVTASLGGILTLPFDTSNVYHNTNVNTTTTAANANRGRDFFNNNIV